MHRSTRGWLGPALLGGWLLLAATLTPAQSLDPAPASASATPLSALQRYTLLNPASPKAEREALFKAAVAASQGGSGYDTFMIGVLFRHGPRHPSQIAPQRFDLAREWLQRCLPQSGCPSMALASLAELEFEAGQDHWARVWSLAYGWVQYEVARRRGNPNDRGSYANELLFAASHSLPAADRAEHIHSLLGSIRSDLQPTLERMIDAELYPDHDAEGQVQQTRHPKQWDKTKTLVSALRIYLLDLDPAGGPARGVALLEALPNPGSGAFLDEAVRALEFSVPSADADGRTPRIIAQPMGYVIRRPLPAGVEFEPLIAPAQQP